MNLKTRMKKLEEKKLSPAVQVSVFRTLYENRNGETHPEDSTTSAVVVWSDGHSVSINCSAFEDQAEFEAKVEQLCQSTSDRTA